MFVVSRMHKSCKLPCAPVWNTFRWNKGVKPVHWTRTGLSFGFVHGECLAKQPGQWMNALIVHHRIQFWQPCLRSPNDQEALCTFTLAKGSTARTLSNSSLPGKSFWKQSLVTDGLDACVHNNLVGRAKISCYLSSRPSRSGVHQKYSTACRSSGMPWITRSMMWSFFIFCSSCWPSDTLQRHSTAGVSQCRSSKTHSLSVLFFVGLTWLLFPISC